MDLTNILSHWQLEKTSVPHVYQFERNGEKISLFIEGFDTRRSDAPFLVGFSGAVTDRETKTPPFFAGQGISKTLNLPLLSFSDPTLNRSKDIGLAFYAGNDRVPNLPEVLADIINKISAHIGRHALLFGGSGGGFAALSTLRHCNTSFKALVWNPQTIVTGYYRRFVMTYFKTAFPDLYRRSGAARLKDPWELAKLIRNEGCRPTIMPWKPAGEVLYLQNGRDDFHLEKHLSPFLRTGDWTRLGRSCLTSSEQNVSVCVGNWGEGHAPPPRQMIIKCLLGLATGRPSQELAHSVEAGLEGDQPYLSCFPANYTAAQSVTLEKETQGNTTLVKLRPVAGGEPVKNVAFQSLANQEVVDFRDYSANVIARLKTSQSPDAAIKVFLCDHTGKKVSAYFPLAQAKPVMAEPKPSISTSIRSNSDAPDLAEESRIFVYGSCVSRDIMNLPSTKLSLVAYSARSSLGSAFHSSPIPSHDINLQRIKSKFQRRMVKADIEKRIKNDVLRDQYDILLVDFIDERFDLLQHRDGGVCTRSRELISSGIDVQSLFVKTISSGSDQHFDLWCQGWESFLSTLKSIGQERKILVNKVWWSDRTSDGETGVGSYTTDKITRANEYLDRLYSHAADTLKAKQIMAFERKVFVADVGHTWGLSPFHYTADYYRDALSKIERFSNDLRREDI